MAFAPWLLVLSLLVYFSSADLPTATLSVVSPQGPYYPGDQVTLRCDIAEYTDWYYYWYRDSSYISGILQSKSIALPDQPGQYQFTCEGHRWDSPSNSQRSKPTPVTVTAMPEPTLEMSKATVYPGEPVTLTCLIQPSGGWTYWWLYQRRSSDNLLSRKESDTNTYTIGSAEESNGGDYACYGRRQGSGKPTRLGNLASLTVLALPTAILTAVPQSPVFTGETVTMTCVIESLSGWTYKWYKEPSRVPVSEGNTFTITSAAESDEGQYWCQGERTGRPTTSQRSRNITLDVKALPTVTLAVKPEGPVFTGETVTMACVIESLGGWTYQWYKGSSRVPVSEGNTFTITSAAESDEGQYWCQGERTGRPAASQRSRSITLDVKESKPHLVLNQKPQLFTGDSVILTCELGVSSGLMFYWYRDTQTSTPWAQTGGNSYSISSAKVSDGGQYWCRAGRGDPVYYTQYSNEVQLNVTGSRSLIKLLAGVGAVSGVLILAFVLFWGCLRASATDHQPRQQSTNQNSPQGQRTNQNSAQDQRSNQNPASDSVYMPLQSRTADTYESITPLYMPLQTGATDVYDTIKPPRHRDEDDNEYYDDVTSPV